MIKSAVSSTWKKDSWRNRPAKHQPVYPDQGVLSAATATLSNLPALVSFAEVEALREKLKLVYEGKCFYLQGGHCAETFEDCNRSSIQPMLDVMDIMKKVITSYTDLPVLTLGRMAGQYAKPRSSPTEIIAGVTMESYKGDIINATAKDVKARIPDPSRMIQGYFRSAACLNFIRSCTHVNNRVTGNMLQRVRMILGSGGIRSCFFHGMLGIDSKKFHQVQDELVDAEQRRTSLEPGKNLFISHEGLLLEYEESMTRTEPSKKREVGGTGRIPYNASTHMLWIGHRTRGLEDAHVEYFRGLFNPVGIKVGPGTTPEVLMNLIKRLNPDNEAGKVILITRFGAEKVTKSLPPLLTAVHASGCKVIWVCDPMHGNTFKKNGFKTRDFANVVKEILNTIAVHKEVGTRFCGLHLEMCGKDVTECIGGPEKLTVEDLPRCFTTACDPRLNFQQSVSVAFAVGLALQNIKPKLTVGKSKLVKYGKLAGLNKDVSKLIFGTLFLHKVADPFALLDFIYSSGCNAFDTAAIYGSPEGRCEEILGSWIKSRNIDTKKLVIITKGGCTGADMKWTPRMDRREILNDLEGSLKRLGVDCVDVYLLHRDDPSVDVNDIVDTMNYLIARKKIGSWGVSNWSLDRLKAAIVYARAKRLTPPIADSTQASLAKPRGPVWPGTTYMSPDREKFYSEQRSVSVFAWESLAKGFMTGKWSQEDLKDLESKPYRERTLIKAYCTKENFKRRTRAEMLAKVRGVPVHLVALAYLMNLQCDTYVLVGTSKLNHFKSNLRMFSVSLTKKECDWLVNGGDLIEQ
ncbi:hypothetical protein AAMO2058_001287900 [Amorphochlora amoebiformis]|mmetsp:Transcript_10468/g.16529  ORF Transcript_10468/g.16529 Transcript_10468/m.16529 type:complete len:802 (-) Transcript_10468:133-2538(-)|eukprot:774256-Amorphochlora_amoeboformis.AAC.1